MAEYQRRHTPVTTDPRPDCTLCGGGGINKAGTASCPACNGSGYANEPALEATVVEVAPVQTDIVARLDDRATESAQDDEDPMPYADVLLMFDAADTIRDLRAQLTTALQGQREAETEAAALRTEVVTLQAELGNVKPMPKPRIQINDINGLWRYTVHFPIVEFPDSNSVVGYEKTEEAAIQRANKLVNR